MWPHTLSGCDKSQLCVCLSVYLAAEYIGAGHATGVEYESVFRLTLWALKLRMALRARDCGVSPDSSPSLHEPRGPRSLGKSRFRIPHRFHWLSAQSAPPETFSIRHRSESESPHNHLLRADRSSSIPMARPEFSAPLPRPIPNMRTNDINAQLYINDPTSGVALRRR